MTDNQIQDQSGDAKYYAQIPNMLDDLLDPYEFRLYGHIKRVCGAKGGKCWQSTKTMAEACKMSVGKVSEVKQKLREMGLIVIKEQERPNGGKPYHIITIIDIWKRNIEWCSRSQNEQPSSPGEQASSQGEIKNNPPKEKLTEEIRTTTSSTTPLNFDDWLQEGQQATNKVAVLKRMYDVLYPHNESPSFSYVGKVAKQVGGNGRLAQLMWETAAKRPAGDVLAYILAINKNHKTRSHRSNGEPRTAMGIDMVAT